MSVQIAGNVLTHDGLRAMLTHMLGENGYLDSRDIEEPVALFVVALAKRAPDTETFFPFGKWATIQAMEGRVDDALARICKGVEVPNE